MRTAVLALAAVLGAGCMATPAAPGPPPRSPAPVVAPTPAAVASAPKPAPRAPEEVASAFAELLAAHDFAAAASHFDAAMARALPPASLEQVWQSVEASAGKPAGRDVIEVMPRPPRTHVWLACRFERSGWNIEVVVDAARRVSGLRVMPAPKPWTPPDYAPEPVVERPVTLGSPALQGIWTVAGKAPARAAVLVHGSGPQDEDASVGPRGQGNKLFKDLAWGLAARGIGVLRYPKRTWAHPEQFEGRAFTLDDEVTRDACAAVQEAGRQLGTGPSQVVLIGHSLGAAMAPRIAKACPSLAGLVMLAAPNRSLDQVLFDQFLYLLALAGKSRSETVSEMSELLAGFSLALAPLGSPGDELSFSGMRAPRSYWVDVMGYDPARTALQVRTRMLLVQGGRDYQVTSSELEAWKRTLRGRGEVTFRLYPALDHRLVAGAGAPGPVDYQKPGHVAREVVDDVARWILGS